jgi:polysaccharide export outer membrane protein
MKKIAVTALALFVTAAAVAQVQPAPVPQPVGLLFPQEGAPTSSDAPIGARDVLDIRVYQDPTFNIKTTVSDDGRVNMPSLGKIEVSGLTPTQLEARIKSLLEGRFLAKADVSVTVLEAGSKPISVIGAVMRPGRIAATGNMTLIQAITNAGGLANGYGKNLYVLRTGANGLTEQITIDIDDLLIKGNSDLNIPLRPSDVVNIAVDQPILVYVLGEVMRPGKVSFRRSQNPTLIQAIADSGGATDRAGRKVILKRMVAGKEKNLEFNFKAILAGKQNDVPLLDNDTIIVRESWF